LSEYEAGNISEGEVMLGRLQELTRLSEPGPTLEYGFTAMASPWVALNFGEQTDLDISEYAIRTVLDASSVNPLVAGAARTGQAMLAVHRNDVTTAKELYAEYERVGVSGLFGGVPALFPIGEAKTLGLLARALGRIDDAVRHFEEEMTLCRRVGYRPRFAWTCSDYAELLLDRDDASRASADASASGTGDREKAIELQDKALTITRELGMRPLTERILARREILRA